MLYLVKNLAARSELCMAYAGIKFMSLKFKFHIYSFNYIIIDIKTSSI